MLRQISLLTYTILSCQTLPIYSPILLLQSQITLNGILEAVCEAARLLLLGLGAADSDPESANPLNNVVAAPYVIIRKPL